MGIIARVIQHAFDKFITLTGETRKDFNFNTLLYTPAGDDSIPLKDERLLLVKVDGTGKYVTVGVLTPSQGAKPGEKIFFSRDNKELSEASIVAKISMLNDGSVTIDTDSETTGDATGDYIKKIKGDEKTSIKKNQTIDVTENYKHSSADSDIHSKKPIGIKGTETQLGGDVLQVFFDDLIKAVTRNPVLIPPVPLPPGAPVPPVPPIMNMHLKGVWDDIVKAATKAKNSCAKALK